MGAKMKQANFLVKMYKRNGAIRQYEYFNLDVALNACCFAPADKETLKIEIYHWYRNQWDFGQVYHRDTKAR